MPGNFISLSAVCGNRPLQAVRLDQPAHHGALVLAEQRRPLERRVGRLLGLLGGGQREPRHLGAHLEGEGRREKA